MLIIVKILLCCAGAIILSFSFLIYETEEKKLQSRIENLWIWLDDLARGSPAAESKALAWIAAVVTKLLDELFGPELYSFRVVVVSIALSVLISSAFLSFSTHAQHKLMFLPEWIWAIGIILLVRRSAMLALLGCSLGLLALAGMAHDYVGTATFLSPFVLSVLSDFIVLAYVRKLLPKFTHSSALRTFYLVSESILVVGLVVLGPLAIGAALTTGYANDYFVAIGMAVAVLNISSILSVLALVLVLGVLAASHLLWPIIGRPVYALQRVGLFTNKKVARVIGVTLILVGVKMGSFQNGMPLLWEAIKKLTS